ncbi:MAG TPA: nuclear transport factor 2 family protein [Longimicrobiales bacterium]|nr:nuclear transport factor 2 family protein [Longimicrobiales bacterium]
MIHASGHARAALATLSTLLWGTLVGCSTPDPTRVAEAATCTLTAEDVALIQDLEAEHEGLVQSADFEAMAALLDDGIVLMAPNQPDVVGKGQVREWQKAWEELTFKSYEQTVESMVGCGSLAYVKMSYSVSIAPLGAADLVSDSGRGIHILRKRSDGAWVITHWFFSSDRPDATG